MGYSKSTKTVRAIEDKLVELARGRATSWRAANPTDAQKWAYKVREALYIASQNSMEFPLLARAHGLFTIEIHGNMVQAVSIVGVPIEQRAELNVERAASTHSPTSTLIDPSLSLVGPSSVNEIVQFWIDCQPTNASISITEASLTNRELDELVTWATSLTPQWEVFHERGQSNLTIQPSRRRQFNTGPSTVQTARPADTSLLYDAKPRRVTDA